MIESEQLQMDVASQLKGDLCRSGHSFIFQKQHGKASRSSGSFHAAPAWKRPGDSKGEVGRGRFRPDRRRTEARSPRTLPRGRRAADPAFLCRPTGFIHARGWRSPANR